MIQELQKFGLSEKQAKVYLANLELGEATASDISIKSNLPRTLVYDLLERLIELGLESYSIKAGKKYFIPSDPKELSRILKEKQQAITEIMPKLEEINKIKGFKRPKVEIYEGPEGMKTVMNKMLNSGAKELFSYGSSRSSFEVIPYFMENWHRERIKKKIKARMIYNNTKTAREKARKFKHTLPLAQHKFMPINLESPTATLIYGNKVVLQSWTKEPFAVEIESELMAQNHKEYFEALWKIAEK
ncbi:MAG: helix-turn-helix domain-containing protein [archaeon]